MARTSGAAKAKGVADGKRSYEDERDVSGDRHSYQENPEVTERAAAEEQGSPRADFYPANGAEER